MINISTDSNVSKPASLHWPSWLEVDLDVLESNVRALRAHMDDQACILAVVKAQAYGLGAGEVAEAALRGGAAGLAVARVTEGVQLRQRGITAPILLLGPIGPGEEDELVHWELTASLTDVGTAARLAAAASRAGKILPVHVKVDTGLTRFGAQPYELLPLMGKVTSLAPLLTQGLYTHFAAADEDDLEFTRRQIQRFNEIRALLTEHGYAFQLLHTANSAAMIRCPEARFDWVRPGITLLGAYPSPGVPRVPALRSAFQFRARVARVYEVSAGTAIGYGCTYRAVRPMRVALVPAGYADGVPRAHSDRGQVLVHGRRAGIVGRVSMDQCVVDVSSIANVAPGDEVVLIGQQADEQISLDEFASWSGTIAHEALTRIGARIPRVYVRNGYPERAAVLSSEGWITIPDRLGAEP